jgi:hypothetical protein
VAGDASILMNIQELGTLSQYQLPVKVVVLNNGWQGMVRQWQESFYEERYSSSEMTGGMPDFPALAEAFGVKGIGITDRAQLHSGLAEALVHPGPVFVDVRVRRNENCYPMVPPGASNAQMVGLPQLRRQTLTLLGVLLALLLMWPGAAAAAEVFQVRSGTLLQVGDGNRSYAVELACMELVADHEAEATAWLRQALPRRTKVNLRPMGQRDGTLLAQVSVLASGADIATGLIEAGLAQAEACP